jgi:hypothetical protein
MTMLLTIERVELLRLAPSSTTTTGLPPVKLMRPQVKLLQDRPFGTSVAPETPTLTTVCVGLRWYSCQQ